MASPDDLEKLIEDLRPIASHALRAKGKMGEENTKYRIVVPVLEALGWPRTAMDFEHSVLGQQVDIALCDEFDAAVVFVEVKALKASLDPRDKAVEQALMYAFKAGEVRWAVLTNGLLWWVYDCHAAKLPIDRRRFIAVDLSELPANPRGVAEALSLVAPGAVAHGALAEAAAITLARQELTALFSDPPRDLVEQLCHLTRIDDHKALTTVLQMIACEPRGAVEEEAPPPKPWLRLFERSSIEGRARELRQRLLSLGATESPAKLYWAFKIEGRNFCELQPLRDRVYVWLDCPTDVLSGIEAAYEDKSDVGHWATGDTRLVIDSKTNLEQVFQAAARAAAYVRTKARA